MRPRLLLMALADWLGPTRLPQALRHAGFDVALLSAPDNLMAQSSFIDYRFALSPPHVRIGLLDPVFNAVMEFNPRLVIPCDEEAATLLQNLALSWDGARGTGGQRRVTVPDTVRELLMRSLGDARSYPMRRNRVLARRAVAALGVAVPQSAPVPYLQVAEAFAREQGWPVVLTREERLFGRSIRVCADEAGLRAAYSDFTREMDLPSTGRERLRRAVWSVLSGFHLAGELSRPRRPDGPQLSVEQLMPGVAATHNIVALEGRALGGFSAVSERVFPEPHGAACVVRLIDDPAMGDLSRKLMGRLGYTGFASIDFSRDAATGAVAFLKFNPRPGPLTHLGALAGCDLCAALHAGLTGDFVMPPKLTRETRVALFPQDWARDPDATDRGAEHLDIPTDDDRLMRATKGRMLHRL